MAQILRMMCLTMGAFVMLTAAASAQPTSTADEADSQGAATAEAAEPAGGLSTAIALGGIGSGLALIGCGIGIGRIGGSAVEAMARQPELAGQIMINMLITAAMVEGATFFAIIIDYILNS